MADETGTPEAGAETNAGPQIDLTPINERLDQFGNQFESRMSMIEQAMQQRGEPDGEPDPYEGLDDYAGLLGEPDPQQDDPQQALRALADLGDQRAQRFFEQNLSPQMAEIQREVQALRVERDLSALKQELPDLNKPDVAEAVAGKVEEALVGLPPEARFNPNIVRLAYQAYVAEQVKTDEGSATRQHHEMENPAGAGPEGSELTWSERILQNSSPSGGLFRFE